MGYYDDWHEGKLESNTIHEAYIIDGNNQVDIKEYITPQNFVFNRGTTEGLFNSFSQDSLTLELNNSTHRFDAYNFKGKTLHIDIYTPNDENVTYAMDYYNLKITKATFNDEYINLEANVKNVDTSRAGWNVYGTSQDGFDNIENVYNHALFVLFDYQTIHKIGDINTFQNRNTALPSYYFDWNSYMESARDSIKTNAEMLTQLMQVCGGYTLLDKGLSNPQVQINHFPTTNLNNEVSAYVYGGCFDETEYYEGTVTLLPAAAGSDPIIDTTSANTLVVWGESLRPDDLILISGEDRILIDYQYNNRLPIDVSDYDSVELILEARDEAVEINYELYGAYATGDNLDGNTATKDGGNLTIPYKVIDDNVLIELNVGTDYYRPTGIVATVPSWVNQDGEMVQDEKEVVYGTRTTAIDLTDNSILKLVIVRSGQVPYNTIFSELFNEVNFPSISFEATITNCLTFNTGDMVALSSGVAPTRFSYVENINTDMFGATIISNNRSGE